MRASFPKTAFPEAFPPWPPTALPHPAQPVRGEEKQRAFLCACLGSVPLAVTSTQYSICLSVRPA